MCRVMAVSPSGFYEWLGRTPSQRSQDDSRLTRLIRESFELSDRTYGSPLAWHDLCALGEARGKNRVSRLMQLAKLQARRKRRRLSGHLSGRLQNGLKTFSLHTLSRVRMKMNISLAGRPTSCFISGVQFG